ncbi:MAG: hypothetical protein WD894_06350 [Pirellulales bacterium]
MSASHGGVGKFEQPWVEWRSRRYAIESVGRSTTDIAPDERVVLARHRVSQANLTDQIEDPAAGFLIWLEPN